MKAKIICQRMCDNCMMTQYCNEEARRACNKESAAQHKDNPDAIDHFVKGN